MPPKLSKPTRSKSKKSTVFIPNPVRQEINPFYTDSKLKPSDFDLDNNLDHVYQKKNKRPNSAYKNACASATSLGVLKKLHPTDYSQYPSDTTGIKKAFLKETLPFIRKKLKTAAPTSYYKQDLSTLERPSGSTNTDDKLAEDRLHKAGVYTPVAFKGMANAKGSRLARIRFSDDIGLDGTIGQKEFVSPERLQKIMESQVVLVPGRGRKAKPVPVTVPGRGVFFNFSDDDPAKFKASATNTAAHATTVGGLKNAGGNFQIQIEDPLNEKTPQFVPYPKVGMLKDNDYAFEPLPGSGYENLNEAYATLTPTEVQDLKAKNKSSKHKKMTREDFLDEKYPATRITRDDKNKKFIFKRGKENRELTFDEFKNLYPGSTTFAHGGHVQRSPMTKTDGFRKIFS